MKCRKTIGAHDPDKADIAMAGKYIGKRCNRGVGFDRLFKAGNFYPRVVDKFGT